MRWPKRRNCVGGSASRATRTSLTSRKPNVGRCKVSSSRSSSNSQTGRFDTRPPSTNIRSPLHTGRKKKGKQAEATAAAATGSLSSPGKPNVCIRPLVTSAATILSFIPRSLKVTGSDVPTLARSSPSSQRSMGSVPTAPSPRYTPMPKAISGTTSRPTKRAITNGANRRFTWRHQPTTPVAAVRAAR